MVPELAGVHHLKLPVSDLTRSIEWYATRFGYRVVVEFREGDRLTGVSLDHPNGGPGLALVEAAELAKASAGFDYFAIGVPDRAAMLALADHLTALGDAHAGVHFATLGWILPLLHDPDGHEVRLYTQESHTDLDPDHVLVVHDAIASAAAAELVWLAERGLEPVAGGSLTA